MSKVARIIVVVVSTFILVSTSLADFVGTVSIHVQSSQGDPLEGLAAELQTSSGEFANYTFSDSSGDLIFTSVEEGSYIVKLLPNQSYDCSACGLFESDSVEIEVDKSDDSYDSQSDTLTLATVSLAQASNYMTITVKEASEDSLSLASVGDPVQGVFVNAFDSTGGYAFGTTGANGKVQFAVPSGSSKNWVVSVYDPNQNYSDAFKEVKVGTGETKISVGIVPFDASLTVSLKTQQGAAYSIPQNSYGGISCIDTDDYKVFAFANLNPSESSATVNVIGGKNYECGVWSDGVGSSAGQAKATKNGNVNLTLTVFERDSSVVVKLKDGSGSAVTGITADLFCFTTTDIDDPNQAPLIQDYPYAQFNSTTGIANLSIIDDVVYQCGFYIIEQSSSENTYLQNFQMESITGDNSKTQTLVMTALKADAKINVVTLDENGGPAQFFIDIFELTNDPTEIGVGQFGNTDEQGEGSFAVAKGKAYRVTAFPYIYTGNNYLFPQKNVVVDDESVDVELQLVEANFDLTINLSVEESEQGNSVSTEDAGLDYTFCTGYSPEIGSSSWSFDIEGSGGGSDTGGGDDKDSGSPFALETTSTSLMKIANITSWQIVCYGFGDHFYKTKQVSYKPSEDQITGILEMKLVEAGEYYETQTYSFSATATTTLTLPDGVSTITIPANTFDSSGTVKLTAGTPLNFSLTPENEYVLGFDFTAYDSNGNQITSQFPNNLTFKLKYDPSDLPQGVTEKDLTGKVFTGTKWENPVSVVIDTLNNVLEIVLNHFSNYSMVENGATSKPGKPKKVKVKQKAGKTKLRLIPEPATSSVVSKYQWIVVCDGTKINKKTKKPSLTLKSLGSGTKCKVNAKTIGIKSGEGIAPKSQAVKLKFKVK
ncbi:MAG: hypothetical protein KDD53_02320 [Bdellovibrionales bacterium]|nr:hypothetical protein [Bdellovibrionales bacterium]